MGKTLTPTELASWEVAGYEYAVSTGLVLYYWQERNDTHSYGVFTRQDAKTSPEVCYTLLFTRGGLVQCAKVGMTE